MITEELYNVVKLKPLQGPQVHKHRLPEFDDPLKYPWNIPYVTSVVNLHEYRYFWFETIKMTKEQEEGCLTIRTEVIDNSGKFFINGYIEECADVLVNNQHLAQQMTNLGWTHIVRNIGSDSYWTEHFDPVRDKLVDFKGDIIGV